MATVRLVLEYDGTDFRGWQRQPDVRTVEGVLREALSAVTGETPRLSAAGRTDSGAHAHGQVVGVPLQRSWRAERLAAALNANLPDDVVVRAAEPAADGFHARFDALSRTYRYVVVAGGERSPVRRRYTWQVRGALDVVAMRDAAAVLEGTHDFAAFGRSPRPGGSTVRTVESVTVEELPGDAGDEATCVIEVCANAFLAGMMRAITGALVAVGQGRLSRADVEGMLFPTAAPRTVTVAPARGLHQWSVTYPAAPPAEARA